ncbi:cob(I)yrinic acid a,c-diamide adenosyltransferase [Thermodesulfatator autotrophicus]|uniref:corrinoid adenosyltransferase n=1 Tax=Thermodesulfatator autotrophicus TaxID=1795632 RepID=A0A177E662_9BACT|nr:cob(I)yrinic acid a,c-diamide adenosyltransferase [Thermodesulfatator autotrophicus]OAG27453.1 cob(I)yrinic acid a,c-diamide adenosyltransferase [Thermodesulfatator autotrophicus]
MVSNRNFTGYVQVYTGNGKGKTTAALGLALRALGAGFKVFLGQFLKSGEYSEIKALKKFEPAIEVFQFGRGCFIKGKPSEEDIRLAKEGFSLCREKILSGEFNLVILDELNLVLHFGLLELDAVLELLKIRPKHIEIVITGRYAPPELIQAADLVTEMREIKHYYQQGILARRGIEK